MRKPMPKMVDRICKCCRQPFHARAADVKRGWGKYCSKSCKAIKQEQRTGQYDRHLSRRYDDDNRSGEFANAHLFSNEEHDCNKD